MELVVAALELASANLGLVTAAVCLFVALVQLTNNNRH